MPATTGGSARMAARRAAHSVRPMLKDSPLMTREDVPPGNHLPASSRDELRDRPMTPRVLIVYASKKGSTREVAQAIADRLEVDGLRTVVQPASDRVDLGAFDAVVIGGALYMGRWHRDARRFLHRHRRVLGTMPVAVYAMGPTTMADHAVASSLGQLERGLASAREVSPVAVGVFGGVVDPARLRFPFNRMPPSDARDWDAISAWADELAAHVLRLDISV